MTYMLFPILWADVCLLTVYCLLTVHRSFSSVYLFFVVASAFGVISQKPLTNPKSYSFPPAFPTSFTDTVLTLI